MANCNIGGSPGAMGDNLYRPRSCSQEFINFVWDSYGFDEGDWDDGFGYPQGCDVGRPLARTFNALWCLEFSAPDYTDESYDKPILNWAGRYARENIDELDARCGDANGTKFAYTVWGPVADNYTDLYEPFFVAPVSMRAGTILHEARHASWTGHDDDPHDSSWEFNGAWRYHVSWLAWFARRCRNTSPAMKAAAVQRANAILDNNFTKDPGFRISSTGTRVAKAFFFRGDAFDRFDLRFKKVDSGYPRKIAGSWSGVWATDIDAAVRWPNGKAYFFKGSEYVRYDVATSKVDAGYPKKIVANWPGLWASDIDAALVWTNGKAYFFKGSQYIRYDIAARKTDPDYPRKIAGNWDGVWEDDIDAALLWTNGKAYFFKGSEYIRYDIAAGRADAGFPRKMPGNWTGVFAGNIDAAVLWEKLG